MIKYKLGDKFNVKSIDVFLEVTGIRPGSQGINIQLNGENHYQVMFNGSSVLLSETVLNEMLKKLEEKRVKEIKEPKLKKRGDKK